MSKPILCFYYLTYRCNARCSFCDIYQRPGGLADTDKVIEHLKQMTGLGVRYIDFTGGEPLLHPDLPRLLQAANDLSFHTSVTTNCLLYPKRAEELRGLVDILHFSLDSADKEQHDAMRGTPCYDKVMESIDIALELGERPDILMTVTNGNFEQIEPLLEMVSRHQLMLVLNSVFDYSGAREPDMGLAKKILELAPRKYLYNNTAFLKLILEGGNKREKPRCKAVTSTVIISPEGELLLPCFHHTAMKLSLQEGIPAVRESETFNKALKNEGRYPFCQGCTINCYLDPSFVYSFDALFLRSIMAKAKYVVDKFLSS